MIVARESTEERFLSPFMANLLSLMGTMLNGRVDYKDSSVTTNCGRISISLEGEDVIYVGGLYVNEDSKFQGCGSNILAVLEAAMARLSYNTMIIRLWPVRSSIGFYLKQGFVLLVETSKEDEYYNQKKKMFGDSWEKYSAKVRAQVMEKDIAEWTHATLEPFYNESGFVSTNPIIYSLWIADIAKDYRYAYKVVQPNRSAQLGSAV